MPRKQNEKALYSDFCGLKKFFKTCTLQGLVCPQSLPPCTFVGWHRLAGLHLAGFPRVSPPRVLRVLCLCAAQLLRHMLCLLCLGLCLRESSNSFLPTGLC